MRPGKDELIIDFNAEIPQLIVARRKRDNGIEVEIINHFKGQEAIDIHERITGGK